MSWAEPTPDYYSRRILILQALFPLDLKNILVLANKQSGKKRKRQMGIHTGGFPELHNNLPQYMLAKENRCTPEYVRSQMRNAPDEAFPNPDPGVRAAWNAFRAKG